MAKDNLEEIDTLLEIFPNSVDVCSIIKGYIVDLYDEDEKQFDYFSLQWSYVIQQMREDNNEYVNEFNEYEEECEDWGDGEGYWDRYADF